MNDTMWEPMKQVSRLMRAEQKREDRDEMRTQRQSCGSLVGRFRRTESVTYEISVGTRMKGGGLISSVANPWNYFNQLTFMTS